MYCFDSVCTPAHRRADCCREVGVRSGKKMEWTSFAVILSVVVAVGQSRCNADLRSSVHV